MPVTLPNPMSWTLTIDSTTLVVTGSMSIGSVMVQLVNRLDVTEDFSDYALWWPKANIWLNNTKSTLDQYGVQSDAQLTFTSTRKFVRLQMPDLRILPVQLDFSVSVFASVCKICQQLGIRHPEELSFVRVPKTDEHRCSPRRRRHNSMGDSLANNPSTASTVFTPMTPKIRSTSHRTSGTLSKSLNSLMINDGNLARSPLTSTKTILTQIPRPTNIIEKCQINAFWLDSSKSLMEQSIHENDLILIRFKYYAFHDLNPKTDAIRINQLYQQAKCSILAEEIDCTEEEMMSFAALQLQIQIQSSSSVNQDDDANHEYDNTDIDQALERLQNSLLGKNATITTTNTVLSVSRDELKDYLRLFKPRRFTWKSFKRYWFVLRDNQLTYYSNESQQNGTPVEKISLKGCEIFPDVNISSKKYSIRLMIPSIDGMNETIIKCSTEEQYATWMAAFRLASKGRSIDQPSYVTERESILTLLNMQIPSSNRHQKKFDIEPDNYVSQKLSKKYKSKQLIERILEAHASVSNLDGMEAKLQYLKAWQALPEFGITTFVVKFKDSTKKEELLGITSNRLLRMNLNGEISKTWWISRMRSWNVNWENQLVSIEFDNDTVHLLPLHGIDSKCIHEFIGAYIFLSMRSTTASSDINDPLRQETLFQRLTAAYC